jgi:hypothetical protein
MRLSEELKKGARASLANLAPFTERSTMNTHSHKEPPLQEKVNHMRKTITSIAYYVSMFFFVAMIAITFAGVFNA